MRFTAATRTFLLAAALAAATSSAVADPFMQDELNWLQTMAFAAHQTNYSGTFIYQYGSHVEVSRVTHVADSAGEHGRLESLDGTKREIIRHNDQVWCYLGDGRVRVEQRQGGREFPALLPQQLSLLGDNYVITHGEEGRVAGFHAHAMLFQPKDNLRYAHKMWAHNDSGLLLKAEVLDEHGDVIEQYAFTQLTIGDDIDRKWISQDTPATSALQKIAVSRGKVTASQKASGWQVDAMPAGFRKIAELRRSLHNKEAPAIQMVYSDGLAGVSIFIENLADNPDVTPGLSTQGIIQIYSKAVDDAHLVTVVGEVPPTTVMQIADSVRYAGE